MKHILVPPVESSHLVPFDGTFRVASVKTKPPKGDRDDKTNEKRLARAVDRLEDLQRRLYADDRFSVLVVFQALDAAGKDGTIRAVTSGIDATGFQVFSFKAPSEEELDHDFLWRMQKRLPERGRIGIFNRSHYEEVLVVRAHPELLEKQRLPRDVKPADLWAERFESIREWEKHLARNGTAILKLWLHVSAEEQRERFLDRIEEPRKNWKFSERDVREREHWDAYMIAYEEALNETSRPWAPWYVIPADDKKYMRAVAADLIADTIEALDPQYPEVSDERRAEMLAMRSRLVDEEEQ